MLAVVVGCGRPNAEVPATTTSKAPSVDPNVTTTPSSIPTRSALPEWRFDTAVTAKGAAVLAIGRPRLRIGQPTFVNELRGRRFVGFDGEAFRVWDTASGLEIARLVFPEHPWIHLYSQVVLLVTAGASTVLGGLFSAPQQWTMPYGAPRALATDRRLIGVLADGTVVVTNNTVIERRALDTDAVIASVPAPAAAWDAWVLHSVAQLGADLYWFQSASVFRWDHASNTVTTVATAPHEWSSAQIRDGASLALARGKAGVDRVSLADGTVMPLPDVTAIECLLPGDKLVYATHAELRIVELQSAIRVSTLHAAADVEKLVCGDDGSFAYILNHEIHVVDASGTEPPMSTPARFVGWGAHGAVVVEDQGASTINISKMTATPGGTPEPTVATVVTTTVEGQTVTVRAAGAGGATRATLHVTSRRGDPALYGRHYLAAAADDKHVVVVWYQPDLEREGRLGSPSDQDLGAQYCAENDREGRCVMEYFAEVWTVEATPRRLWTTRFDRAIPTNRPWPFPKEATAVALTHDGKGALFGFRDGDVIVANVASGAMHIESLHHAPVARIETSPDDAYVLTQDLADEQRVWPLAY